MFEHSARYQEYKTEYPITLHIYNVGLRALVPRAKFLSNHLRAMSH